jgi:hypothetical protein
MENQEVRVTEMSERGRALYEKQLKSTLEPAFNGQTVAIHLDSGDYAVAPNAPDVM